MLDPRSAAASSGSSCATSAIVCTPPASADAIARAALRDLLDRLLERVRLLVERVLRLLEVVERAIGPVGDVLGRLLALRVSGMPALSIPSTIVSVACTARSRPLRTNPVRPCGVSDCGSSPPAVLASVRRPDVLDDRLQLAAPDADGAAHVLRPLAGGDRLVALVAAADRGGDDDHGDDADGGEDPGERAARIAYLPGAESSSTTATSSFQKRSTVGMLTRSSGECGNSICGPNESMSRPGTLRPDHRRLEAGVHGGDDRRLPELRARRRRARGGERGRVEVRAPAAVVVLDLERAAGEPGGGVERGDHLGERRVVRRAREAVQRQLVALGDRLAERRPRLDEIVEVGAQRERPGRHERDGVEQRCGGLVRPRLAGRVGGVDGDRDARIGLRVRVADRLRGGGDRRPGTPARGRPGRSRSRPRRAGSRCGSCRPRARPAGRAPSCSASRRARPSTLIAFDRPSAMPGAGVAALAAADRDGERHRVVDRPARAAPRSGSTCRCCRHSRPSAARPPRCRG